MSRREPRTTLEAGLRETDGALVVVDGVLLCVVSIAGVVCSGGAAEADCFALDEGPPLDASTRIVAPVAITTMTSGKRRK
jgi:hypothetical protein